MYQPRSLRSEEAAGPLHDWQPDVIVVAAFGQILRPHVLELPPRGCINVHASLLPRWRGAAPIQRAIQAGDRETGITIMQMDAGLDTGAMLATATCEIDQQTTAASLHDRPAELGPQLLLQVLADLEACQRQAQPQDDQLATYADKILKSEAELDWRQSAQTLDRAIRAFNPFPVCFSKLGGERVKVWRARPDGSGSDPAVAAGTILQADREGIVVSCGDGHLLVQQLQLPGGKQLAAEQVLNARGELFAPGQRFELPADQAP